MFAFLFSSCNQGVLAVVSTHPQYLSVIKSSLSFPALIAALHACHAVRSHGVASLANLALRGLFALFFSSFFSLTLSLFDLLSSLSLSFIYYSRFNYIVLTTFQESFMIYWLHTRQYHWLLRYACECFFNFCNKMFACMDGVRRKKAVLFSQCFLLWAGACD